MAERYDVNLQALRTAILAFGQKIKDISQEAQNAAFAEDAGKLEGKTLSEVVELISGVTNLTIADVHDELTQFIARRDNPLEVTAEQVQLGNLQNYGMATVTTVLDDELAEAYVSPETLWAALNHFWSQKVGAAPETLDTIEEIAQALQNNPDVLDALQTQVSNKATRAELQTAVTNLEQAIQAVELEKASNAEALAGTDDVKYMTAATTQAVRADIESGVAGSLDELTTAFQDAIALIDAED